MENTKIQWAKHTFNPWIGCTKVAPECKFCYAEEMQDHRYHRVKWGKGQPRSRTSAAYWKGPLKWNKEAEGMSEKPRVFCASLADVFDEEVDPAWRHDLFALITVTQNLDWLLLTKRPQNVKAMAGNELPCDNVWLGVSAGVDPSPIFEVPAAIHFLSCEPMLRALDETHADKCEWIIFGGESGKHARQCSVDWIREGIEFCRSRNIAAFVKQLGENPVFNRTADAEFFRKMQDSHGGDINEWPSDLRVRELPTSRCSRQPEASSRI